MAAHIRGEGSLQNLLEAEAPSPVPYLSGRRSIPHRRSAAPGRPQAQPGAVGAANNLQDLDSRTFPSVVWVASPAWCSGQRQEHPAVNDCCIRPWSTKLGLKCPFPSGLQELRAVRSSTR